MTKFEHRLGVSDNELPGGKRSQDKGQFALSSYDQSILAHGPPQTGDGEFLLVSLFKGHVGISAPHSGTFSRITITENIALNSNEHTEFMCLLVA